VPDVRPDFNEYSNWSRNHQGRDGTTIDLWLIHTEEGNSNADGLARFLRSTEGTDNPRSYHYTISEDYTDHGVTVVDVVDTDYAAWAVGNSNDRSINLCFAGSWAAWSREQWMRQSRAIDVAAYLCVQDCTKYSINPKVIAPPYNSDPPGISDHRYCTQYLKDGNTHTDVGDNFPWDFFGQRVAFWTTAEPIEQVPGAQPPTPVGPADDQLTLRWRCLGDQTLVEAVAELRDFLLGTEDRNKQGAV
jgi:N-acetyl-anhydromuramyl-L-alanine amidase AmpD